MRSKIVFRAALAGIALSVVVVVGSLMFERVESIRDVGFRGDARVNHLLALGRMFERRGVPVRQVRGFAHLPPFDHTLLVAPVRRAIGFDGAERLLEWVEAGGHLVVAPVYDDELLDYLPVERDHDSGEFRLTVYSHSEVARSFGPLEKAEAVSFEVGGGLVTVIADGSVLSNEHIDEGDNGRIAWHAIVVDREPAGLWIIWRDQRPSPWVLLAGQAEPVAWSVAGLLAAYLWGASRRFGPLLPAREVDRRRLPEHVQATGTFLWHAAADRTLHAAVVDALRPRLLRDGGGSLDAAVRDAARRLGRDPDRASAALTRRRRERPGTFTRDVRLLEALRRSQ